MTILKKTGLIINLIAKIALGYYLFDWTIAQFIPIEFADYKITKQINIAAIFIVPVAISLTSLGLLKKVRTRDDIILRIILTQCAAILMFFILTSFASVTILGSAKLTGDILFENKNNNKIKIVKRYDDAGLLGEGPTEIYKTRPFLSLFIIATKIDTTELNKNEWTRINRR